MGKRKFLISILLSTVIAVMPVLSVNAEESFLKLNTTNTSIAIPQVQIYTSSQDCEDILQSRPELREYNNKLMNEGYILENITVKTFPRNSISYKLNSDTSDEIVVMNYRQPARSKKVFAEDIYNSISYLNNPVMVLLGTTNYVWIPFTFFGLTTEMIGTSLADEWYEVSDNNTLHKKVAYIYDEESDQKFWGADASCLHISATVIMVVYDDNKDATQVSESINTDLKSPNYDNDAELLRLGHLHYKDLFAYTETYDPTCDLDNLE